jgi:hypothetical protein
MNVRAQFTVPLFLFLVVSAATINAQDFDAVSIRSERDTRKLLHNSTAVCLYFVSEGVVSALKAHPKVSAVRIVGASTISMTVWTQLTQLNQITHLRVEGLPECNSDICDDMTNLSALRVLVVRGISKVADGAFQNWTRFGSIEDLTLEAIGCLTDRDLKFLEKLKTLKSLSFNGAARISGTVISCLTHLEKLERCDLSGCASLNIDGLRRLADCTSIQDLRLPANPIIQDKTFSLLATLELKSLRIDGLDDVSGIGLADLKSLRRIECTACQGLTVEGLSSWKQLKHLEAIELIECPTKCLDGVTGCKTVKEFRLERMALDVHVAEILAGFTDLTMLSLHSCSDMTPEFFGKFRECKSLRFLDIGNSTTLTNEIMVSIGSIPALRQVVISSSGSGPKIDVRSFRRAYPKIELVEK